MKIIAAQETISVALCTYNGERFLWQQLQTILNQTRQPDQVVVFDDISTDRTVELLSTFSASAPFPVEIHSNLGTLGPAKNFEQAISTCTGSIISLCDQDDLWQANKLQLMEQNFTADPTLAFAFSDAQMCDQSGQRLDYTLWQSVGFAPALQRKFEQSGSFDVLLRQNIVTGATLCFRSAYRSLLLPIGAGWMHDGWIALLLSAVAHGKAIELPLIQYRQHESQAVGAAWRSLYQQYQNAKQMPQNIFAKEASAFEAALERLQEQTDFDLHPRVLELLQKKIRHSRQRDQIRAHYASRLRSVYEFAAGRYNRFALGWKSFAQDLLL